ncbi:hypothetical protein AN5378.2 [Aspergillus nidulans FGSC A4]|uniref:Siderochrome-iron transporter Sit1, putative (AFU_orthologue AFUA_7G06060) n=1 Tax=Emericella nidulans (strain FGSC A4 / ATCC 38163 / CBS 112.46 / NRRL 194 / M139) TaxID=227321 RepID=Q5B252_EMENI|nr:hypothetical protein [Aspergillus nidulans FGSC A4]EAA62538.1 hypothetical protein AN5378.2 [Aspergillus nidulans FGSC A4]CBF82008.1 TPA: siderochrome-iron transporter Sit1, putative (AFU_orthologue; AFUA_7G06060) [Aspergillus nidulans FGSC A4]|eukprot:XP_662982.1 hypothetical protein AN5378.2 [Aspergillus nidulans FGSC A4]
MAAAWENKGAQEASTAAPEPPPGYTEANRATHLPQSDLDAREMSPGVRRIELINTQLGRYGRIAMFFGIWLIAYVYGLDGGVRNTYQVHTSAFPSKARPAPRNGELCHSQPAFDGTGAAECDCGCGAAMTTLTWIGRTFCAGAVIYQIGYTGIMFLVEVLIGDTTSTRSRLLFSYIPATPFIINTWIGGNVTDAVLKVTSWRWGIGMFAIIFPVCSIPLFLILLYGHSKAKKITAYPSLIETHGLKHFLLDVFWRMDVLGIILLIAVFALILVPFTLAGGNAEQWKQAKIIAPLVIGVLCVPLWIVWESKCRYPMVPFKLLKDRAVYGAIGIAIMLNTGNYLYTVLMVSFDESNLSATRISSLYSFASVITGCILGAIVIKIRRLKPFIVAGTFLFTVAFGILYRFRGGPSGDSYAGIVAGEVVLGIAGGMFPYPAQASIQTATKHEHLAIVTALFLSSYNIGSALGGSISGAIWSQTLLPNLTRQLGGNSTLASQVYADPFAFALSNPVGTPDRDAVIAAYMDTQRLLCITGLCLTVPLIGFALCIRNPRLNEKQSLEDAEKD